MRLTRSVFVETKIWGCNVGYVLTDDGIVLIDTPQRPTIAAKLKEELEALGDIRYIINTECHRDHFTGNCLFDVPVVAQEKTRAVMLQATMEHLLSRVAIIDPDGYDLLKQRELNVPAITFGNRLTLYAGSHTIELLHHPGHTAGQTSVLLPEEGVVFTGDNVFYKSQAFLNSGNVFEWLDALDEIAKLDFDYLVPGHGEVCDKAYLAEQKAFLEEWVDAVKTAIHKGCSKEQAIAEISFEERYPMSLGTEDLMAAVQKNNVAYLYDMLQPKENEQ